MDIIKTKPNYYSNTHQCKVLNINHITDSTFTLTFHKPNFEFASGQHVILSIEGDLHDREYSICSSENDKRIELLIKEVKGGYFTPQLKDLKKGDLLNVRGPHGSFCLNYEFLLNKKIFLICSGTGIAPFRSMFLSYPDLNFKIIHGIRYSEEEYFKTEFKKKYISCVTRDNKGDYIGRVTDYIKEQKFPDNSVFYLCGNFNMIYDVQNLLTSKGHNINNIFTEVYF